MEGVQKAVLDKAVRLLDSLRVDYAIVVSPKFSLIKGDIQVLEKKTRRNITAPYGTYAALFRAHGVDEMEIGDVVSIPCGDHDPANVRKTVSAHITNKHGAGSSMTSVSEDGSVVEVMRIDNGE